jgi:hypothetical protein
LLGHNHVASLPQPKILEGNYTLMKLVTLLANLL